MKTPFRRSFTVLALHAALVLLGTSALSAADSDWVTITPAADLKGWTRIAIPPTKPLGREQWHVDSARNVLVCEGDGGHDMLRFDQELKNCALRVEFRFVPSNDPKARYNSGLFIRNNADGTVWHQCQLTMDGGYLFGATPGEGGQSKRFKTTASEKRVKPAGEWNVAEITATGSMLTVQLNGAEVTRFTECGQASGYVALESEGYAIEFRNVQIRKLP